MIQLPDDISNQDVNQWLNGGWCLAEIQGEYQPAYFIEARPSQQVIVEDVDGSRFAVGRNQIRAHWPRCGAVNVDGVAVIVQRIPLRQYRRTYNTRQVELVLPRKWEALKRYGEAVRNLTTDNSRVVAALFRPTYYTYRQAIQRMRDGDALSVAINPHVILVAATEGLLVYYRGLCAAQIDRGRLWPIGADEPTLARLAKYFEGEVTL